MRPYKSLLLLAALVMSDMPAGQRPVLLALGAMMAFAVAETAADLVDHRLDGARCGLTAGAMAAVALGLGVTVDIGFGEIVAGYLLIRAGYGLRFTRIALLEALAVPAGLLLRVVAAGQVGGTPVPLLLTAVCGAVVVALGGRPSGGFASVWRLQMRTVALAGVILGVASWAAGHLGAVVVLLLLMALFAYARGSREVDGTTAGERPDQAGAEQEPARPQPVTRVDVTPRGAGGADAERKRVGLRVR